MQHSKILDYLYSLESSKVKLGLENIKELLEKINNPQNGLKCIHVAGTNGKGSVCAMIFSVLRQAGYKVGLYTSPHLKKFNERIRINENLISDKDIVKYYLKLRPLITNQSFFEITTAMAFEYFKEGKVDFVVLEVGLGGRLDATNVVTPLISVITNIDLEHTELLGKSVEEIAFEKAGVIKRNIPVVCGAKGKALKVIKKIAHGRNSILFLPKKYPKLKFKYLNGQFQQENKDIALTAIDILTKKGEIVINEKQKTNGVEKTKWPARMEFISKNVLVDCAHNPAGFEVLKNELTCLRKERKIKNFIFVLGMQKTKNAKEMLRIMSSLISYAIFTKSGNNEALEPEGLEKIFNNKKKSKIMNNPIKALSYARKIASKNDMVVVAGSIYMVGEVI